jgi:hypothetical protein
MNAERKTILLSFIVHRSYFIVFFFAPLREFIVGQALFSRKGAKED